MMKEKRAAVAWFGPVQVKLRAAGLPGNVQNLTITTPPQTAIFHFLIFCDSQMTQTVMIHPPFKERHSYYSITVQRNCFVKQRESNLFPLFAPVFSWKNLLGYFEKKKQTLGMPPAIKIKKTFETAPIGSIDGRDCWEVTGLTKCWRNLPYCWIMIDASNIAVRFLLDWEHMHRTERTQAFTATLNSPLSCMNETVERAC